jgi:hypothetical protein
MTKASKTDQTRSGQIQVGHLCGFPVNIEILLMTDKQ